MGKDFWQEDNKLKVQYVGQSGYTVLCLLAIDAILNTGILPDKATIVSCGYDRPQVQNHLFLFWNWGYFPLTVVPSGFASGYGGEGPKGFSLAICMIRSKRIPIHEICISESDFAAIDQGRIDKVDAAVFQKIKAKSEIFPFPFSPWVLDEDEKLLERGQLWRKFYWREPKADWVTEAVGDIDLYHPEVGKGLRLALDKLEKEETKEWQSTGILIRDAWIELTQKLCQDDKIDTSDIRTDDVTARLAKLKLEDEIRKLAKSAFDLSLKIQHDRKVEQSIARTCIITTAVSMQTVIREVS